MSVHKINSGIAYVSESHPEKGGGLAGKVARAVLVAFIALVGNILTLGIPLACRLIFDARQKARKEEIEAKQVDHLFSALTLGLAGEEKWKQSPTKNSVTWRLPSLVKEMEGKGILFDDAKYFAEKVLWLRDQINKLKIDKKKEAGSLEKIYKQFQEWAQSPRFMRIYHQLGESAPVNFLKALAAKFHSAPMDDMLIQHAKEELGEIKPDLADGYSISKLGEVLAKQQQKVRFRWDNFLDKAFWAITHPIALYHSWESRARPDLYDSRESNPTYTIQEIELDGKKVRLVAGPTPYNDPVYRQIFLQDGHEVRFNIMDTSKSHEYQMIERMEKIAQESDGHLEHIVFGFVAKKKKGYLDHKELDPLIDGYETALLQSRGLHTKTGMVVSKDHLSDGEIRSICQEAKNLMRELNPDLSTKEARHAILVAVDTMMAVKILKKTLQKHSRPSPDIDPDLQTMTAAVACKQCFDRGPVYLSALLLFLRGQSDPLSEKEFYRIAGFPLFRAPLNEGREQLKKKFVVFQALTKILGSRTELLFKHVQKI